jgi:hypothetical protein
VFPDNNENENSENKPYSVFASKETTPRDHLLNTFMKANKQLAIDQDSNSEIFNKYLDPNSKTIETCKSQLPVSDSPEF